MHAAELCGAMRAGHSLWLHYKVASFPGLDTVLLTKFVEVIWGKLWNDSSTKILSATVWAVP